MTPRQCEIAAESYAASLFARVGYDVLVQYGANQPHYDLVASKDSSFLPISVKGSQDGGWMLAVRYKEAGRSYHDAIDTWLAAQRVDVVFMFVQFFGLTLPEPPRAYIARAPEVALQLKSQRGGKGYGSLQENIRRIRPGSRYDHQIPTDWSFSLERLRTLEL